jgi:cation diffusion facilitator family transporter
MAGSTREIVKSLVANSVVAAIKLTAAIFTGSGSMLAEAIHSFADCANQVLLLVGVKQGQKKPDATHPLGYGRNVYFWSFIVALLLFSGGGVFSIYEGIHKIIHPDPVERVWLGIGILAASMAIEGWAWYGNIVEIRKRRGKKPFARYLVDTKDSDLVVIFGENTAAVLGLTLAMAALLLAHLTGDPHWDGAGSLAVGVVLVAVALFLAKEVKALLVGEAADPEISEAASRIAKETANTERVLNIVTVQQGPGEVMVSIKLAFTSNIPIEAVCDSINDFEKRLRTERPEVRWLFVEPDIPREV